MSPHLARPPETAGAVPAGPALSVLVSAEGVGFEPTVTAHDATAVFKTAAIGH